MIRFAENLNKMITAGLGGALEAPRTEVAVGHCIRYLEASGPVASFESNIAAPIRNLRVDMHPIQAGSGDPSPDNIRPITGRDSVTVTRTGKNLLELSPTTRTVNGVTFTVNDDGTISLSGTATQNTNYFLSDGERSLINGSFVLSGCPSGGGISTYYLRIDNATGGSLAADYGDGKQFTISDGKIYTVYINVKSGVNTNGLVFKPMIELGSTATSYEPYTGQIVEVQLGQTVYGGTVDVTGVLTVEWENIASYDGEALPGEWISDRDAYAPGTTPTTGAQVCYKLATPITIDLTSAQLTTLKGQNNVWSDAGDVTLEYPYYEETEGY